MKIRIEIEPGDIVRAAQKKHVQLPSKLAEATLKHFEITVNNVLTDAKLGVVRSMADYAIHQHKEQPHAHA